ncbi:MAG: hypothetical protein M3463_08230 [Verrucomicrobiota bacterium]|nr:hypothetical protein [Verrucomicrobiota bacterium]
MIADAPDNAGPVIWLVYQKNASNWASRKLDPFAPLYEAFRKTDPGVRTLFRPSILKMEWLSDRLVRFRGYCNTGTYWMTLDTSSQNAQPTIARTSDELLDE